MRAFVISDLHDGWASRGKYLWDHPIPDADVCICAGDICEGITGGLHWLSEIVLPHMPVVYVPGNHEFYHSSFEEQLAGAIEDAHDLGVHLLLDRAVTVAGQRFVGGILWTDYRLFRNPSRDMHVASLTMNDHRAIHMDMNHEIKFRPKDAFEMHVRTRRFLEANIDPGDVVVTHHAPHPGSVAPEYARDIGTSAFVSDLSDLIEAKRPALWVHGHTHTSFDYAVGDTRIVCNPQGYGMQNHLGFKPGLVVEIDSIQPKVKP